MTQSWFADNEIEQTEVEQRYERFVAEGPGNRDRLHDAMRAAGASVDDLPTMVEFVAARRSADGEADIPAWYGDRDQEAGITAMGAALHDGLIHDIAARMMAATGATWELFLATDPLDSRHLQPVLPGVPNRPQEIARACVVGVLHETRPATAVLGMIQRAVDNAKAPAATPQWQVWVEPHDDGRTTIGLPSEAIELLGGEQGVIDLWAEIEAQPWISDLQHHDPGEATAIVSISAAEAATWLTAILQSSIT